ncbi:MAG TPA: LLM class flavin-dependent oxidoreductase [Egibacteraceae bacterium]|jgi:alkanesulfonate monooxygenase SsuD/methylene tetrahydromethanopterin reductase-like flavin-dependent oxidoreductase (luciferase family)|nr:LLM class flavin-dependent oxidoreductase [Egibacteraceae bacterium]
MATEAVRFGIQVPQDAPFDELRERWRMCEQLGFDVIHVADHMGDPRDLHGVWHDGWTTLTAMATSTTRIRVGILASNPILHHPAVLAKAASSVDVLSGGRLELGLGCGIAAFDHAATGTPYWGARERVQRFSEFVEVVDRWLRAGDEPVRHCGQHYRSDGVPVVPAPVQQPRPTIIIAGQSPTVLRTAARHGDVWNTHGPFGADLDEIAARTRQQNSALDQLCESAGRDPSSLRRSLLLIESRLAPTSGLDAWANSDWFERIVTRFVETGIREFIAFWPQPHHMEHFEHAAGLLPELRAG